MKEVKENFNKKFETKSGNDSSEKKEVFFKIPYLNQSTYWFCHKLREMVTNDCKGLELKIVLMVKNKIRSFVSSSRMIPVGLLSDLIYEFKCPTCNLSYVGETYRQLHVRAGEHIGISWRTGKRIKTIGFSAINDHIQSTGHKGDFSDFKIVCRNQGKTTFSRRILEALCIKRLKPKINGNNCGFLLKLF